MAPRLNEEGQIVDDEMEQQGQQKIDPRDTEIAELKEMVRGLSGQLKQVMGRVNQPVQPQNGNQPPSGRDAVAAYFTKHAQKYGVDVNDKQWSGTIQFLTDVLHDAVNDAVKPFAEWKEQAHNAILGLEDEVGFTQFSTDPANAKLNREVLPELRDFYASKQYYNPPEGHTGKYTPLDGIRRAYKDWSDKQARLTGQPTQTARPATRPAQSGQSFPKDITGAGSAPVRGGAAERYKEENPDLGEAIEQVGSTALLTGGFDEE